MMQGVGMGQGGGVGMGAGRTQVMWGWEWGECKVMRGGEMGPTPTMWGAG